jgi:hypothetical protein
MIRLLPFVCGDLPARLGRCGEARRHAKEQVRLHMGLA